MMDINSDFGKKENLSEAGFAGLKDFQNYGPREILKILKF